MLGKPIFDGSESALDRAYQRQDYHNDQERFRTMDQVPETVEIFIYDIKRKSKKIRMNMENGKIKDDNISRDMITTIEQAFATGEDHGTEEEDNKRYNWTVIYN